MKVGILYSGISNGNEKDRNFSHCFKNHERMFLSHLRESHDVSLFFCTYGENESIQSLKEDYDPKKILVLPYENSNQVNTRLQSLSLIENEELDFVFWVRFDTHYLLEFPEWNIDFKKFNIVSREANGWWERKRYTNDTFFCFPHSLSSKLISAMINLRLYKMNGDGIDYDYSLQHIHNLYAQFLENELPQSSIHFMFDDEQLSGHRFNSICTKLYVDLYREKFKIDADVLSRFSDPNNLMKINF